MVEERNTLLADAQDIARKWEAASATNLNEEEKKLAQEERWAKLKEKNLQLQAKAKQEEADRTRAQETLSRREKEIAEMKKRVADLESGEKATADRARQAKGSVQQKQSRVEALEAKVRELEEEGRTKDARYERLKKVHAKDKADAQCWRTAGDKIARVRTPEPQVRSPEPECEAEFGGGIANMVAAGERRARVELPPPRGAIGHMFDDI